MKRRTIFFLTVIGVASTANAQEPVGDALTRARGADGTYISWREHLIDDPAESGIPFNGSDGLVVGDLDKDGFPELFLGSSTSRVFFFENREPLLVGLRGIPQLDLSTFTLSDPSIVLLTQACEQLAVHGTR